MAPLIEEIAVNIDAVWLRQVLRDQLADGREVSRLFRAMVLHVAQVGGGGLSTVVAHSKPDLQLLWRSVEVGLQRTSRARGVIWDANILESCSTVAKKWCRSFHMNNRLEFKTTSFLSSFAIPHFHVLPSPSPRQRLIQR